MWIKFLAWLIGLSGYTVIRTERWESAIETAAALGAYVSKSGALNDRRSRTPRAVRKIDTMTAIICEHLRETTLGYGQTWLVDEYLHESFYARNLEAAVEGLSARLKAYEGKPAPQTAFSQG